MTIPTLVSRYRMWNNVPWLKNYRPEHAIFESISILVYKYFKCVSEWLLLDENNANPIQYRFNSSAVIIPNNF